MIMMYPVWVEERSGGKEHEKGVGSRDLFLQIDFIGPDYLPVDDIPRRVMGMNKGTYAVVRERDSLDYIVYGSDPLFFLLLGKEQVIDGQRATTIVRPVYRPGVGGGDFIDINMVAQNLVRYAGEMQGLTLEASDIPGFTEGIDRIKEEMEEYQRLLSDNRAGILGSS